MLVFMSVIMALAFSSISLVSAQDEPPPAAASTPEPAPAPEPPPEEPLSEPPPPPEEGPPPPPAIEYPISELGNCGSVDECRTYCDDLSHKDACVIFGAAHGLIDEDEAQLAHDLPTTGPGGCTSKEACDAYCEDPANHLQCTDFAVEHGYLSEEEAAKARILATTGGPGGCATGEECEAFCQDPANTQACVDFAKEHGFISEAELQRIETQREVMADIRQGPGGCTSENECRTYCADPSHADACIEFATKNGLMTDEDAKRLKVLVAGGPGGCKSESECRAYCEDPTRGSECIDYAVKNGFMTEAEAALARKLLATTGPGGCQGIACRAYCEDPSHVEECLGFAEKEGLLSGQELAQAKKFVKIMSEGGGPGGCKGPQECKAHCDNPSNQQACFDFAKGQGLISPEDQPKFEAGLKIRQKMAESGGPGGCRTDDECRVYCTDPAHVEECVAFGAAHGGLSEEETRRMLQEFASGRFDARGEFGPPADIARFEAQAMKEFEKFRQLEEQFRSGGPGAFPGGPGGGFPPTFPSGSGPGGPAAGAGFAGPGGCTSPAECIKYCTEHFSECQSFQPPGSVPSGFPGQPVPPGALPPPPGGSLPPPATTARGTAAITLELQPSSGLFLLKVSASQGVKEFSLGLASGSSYGAGISGCPSQYVNNTVVFRSTDFPITNAYVIDCQDVRYDIGTVVPLGVPVPPPPGGLPPGAPPPAGSPAPYPDPATICAQYGGTWDGTTCQVPQLPPGAFRPASLPIRQAGLQFGAAVELASLFEALLDLFR